MSFLAKLLPQEDKFFELMRELSAKAQTGAQLLKAFTECTAGAKRDGISKSIAQTKAESKAILAQVTREVSLSFITPFDREDIQDFAGHLYRISKTIDKIRERLELHNIESAGGDFSRQVDLIVREAAAMEEIVQALTRKGAAKTIVEKVAVLNALEADGDEVLGELLASLFRDTRDVRDLILRKDIYDMLEKVLDRYRDAADVALQIVLKHS